MSAGAIKEAGAWKGSAWWMPPPDATRGRPSSGTSVEVAEELRISERGAGVGLWGPVGDRRLRLRAPGVILHGAGTGTP
jgi:hypothetical protein